MIKRGILCIFIALAVTFSGFSDEIKVEGTAPTFGTNDPNVEMVIDNFNDKLEETFDKMISEIQDMIDDMLPDTFSSDQLLNGFGTSSIFASHGATMRAYADYKSISISLGSMLGLKFPEGSTKTLLNGISSGGEFDLDSIDDTTFGINPQFFSLHLGLHPSALIKIFPKSLFLGLRLGFFGLPNLSIPIDSDIKANLNFKTFTIGATANYQLIPSIGLGKIIIWRGINIGSGLIFQTTKLDLSVPFDEQRQNMSFDEGSLHANLDLVLDPTASLNININTVTIPVEISTALKLLFLNIPIGFGVDIGFGKSELLIGMNSNVTIDTHNNTQIYKEKNGNISVRLENDNAPTALNWKLMTGLGFTFGDAFVIDIPITFYLKDGFNLGFTMGVRF